MIYKFYNQIILQKYWFTYMLHCTYFSLELKDKKIEEGLNAIPTLPKSEIVKRLRDRGQPILLFGETLINACERLKQVEMDAPDAVGIQASGSTNDFK